MTKWREVLRRANADMLFAEDLGGYGVKPIDVEIVASGVSKVKSQDGPMDMPWLQFRGKNGPSKKLGLNRGMCKVMTTLAGTDEIEAWRGWVTLIVVKTTYTDKETKQRLETDAIRISTMRPKRPTSKPSTEQKSADQTAPASSAPTEPAPTESASDLSDADKRAIEMAEAEEQKHGG